VTDPSLFERVGGQPFFDRLVDDFYDGVAVDPRLRPMYPEADLAAARRRFRMFLAQYWGGPTTYSEERGHPRLRQRHAPFPVDVGARDAWLAHMREALDRSAAGEAEQAELWTYFTGAADFLRNTPG